MIEEIITAETVQVFNQTVFFLSALTSPLWCYTICDIYEDKIKGWCSCN